MEVKKITDIFSYVKDISVLILEEIFYQSAKGICKVPYEFFYSQEDFELSSMQLLAVQELRENNKKIAYVVSRQRIIAIIGYLE